MHEEDPVGYLGGEVGQNPYGEPDDEEISGYLEGASSFQDSNPYGGSEDEEIAGYLEGAAGEDEMPMLPPVEEPEAAYSAKDFIDSDPAMDSYDPYAEDDPYAASGEDYGYDGGEQSDASYFDDMGHTDEPETQKYAQEEEYEEGYEDDSDQPKTISQQDAESIIRRITTKRIVPPEAETRPKPSAQPSLTRSGGGFRTWPLLVAFLLLAAVGGVMFREQIGEQLHMMGYPELAAMIGYEHEEAVEIDTVKEVETPEQRRERVLREMVIKSELKAFGLKEKDLKKASKSAGAGRGEASTPSPTDGGN